MGKLFKWAMLYFDDISDAVSMLFGGTTTVLLGGYLGVILGIQNYLAVHITEYLLLAFFSMVGVTLMYFIKMNYPEQFSYREAVGWNMTSLRKWFIDCVIGGVIGAFCANFLVDFVFKTIYGLMGLDYVPLADDYGRLILGAIIIGASSDTIVKKYLKGKRKFEDKDSNDAVKVQALDGEDDGLNGGGKGTPVPDKLPPNN